MNPDFAYKVRLIRTLQERLDEFATGLPFESKLKVHDLIREDKATFKVHAFHADSHDESVGRNWWSGREWVVALNISDESLATTVWLAVKQYMEHELAENFKHKGVVIFDPHKLEVT